MRRRDRHEKIIKQFKTELGNEMTTFNDKIEELLMALKSKLNLNRGDVEMSIYSFDDEETLESVTEAEFTSTWSLCKSMNASNLEAISRFRDAYFQIQRAQTSQMQDILNTTLAALYKNAHLPRDQSQQLIETESMLMNEANMSNTRYVSRMVLNMIEKETSSAIQYRISFSERKTKWIHFRTERRKDRFLSLLRSEEIQTPEAVENALEQVRERQTTVVEERNHLILQMAALDPDAKFSFEKWKKQANENQTDLDTIITQALDAIKTEFIALTGRLYDEERLLYQDLHSIIDPDDIDRHLMPISMEVDATVKSYYVRLRELHVHFEDLSLRSMRQMGENGKLLHSLLNEWTHHQNEIDTRYKELETRLDMSRNELDQDAQQREALISIKITDLRQTDEADKIDKKEVSIGHMLKESVEALRNGHDKLNEVFDGFNGVLDQELEVYKINLERVVNAPDRLIDEMEQQQRVSPSMTKSLSKLSLKAGSNWAAMIGNEKKSTSTRSSSRKAVTETTTDDQIIVRLEATHSFFWDEQSFLAEQRRPMSTRRHQNADYDRPWFYETGISPLPQTPAEATDAADTTVRPFSFIAESGDDALNDEAMLPVYRENFITDETLLEKRNQLRLQFAQHFDTWLNRVVGKATKQHGEWRRLSNNEIDLKIKVNRDRLDDIRVNISAVRKEEVKMHLKRLQRHENQVVLKMKDLLKLAQAAKSSAEEILAPLNEIDNSRFASRLGEAKKVLDLEMIKQDTNGDLDAIIDKLQQNHSDMLTAHYAGIREIRDATDVMLKSLVLFKDGGNFSRSEMETFKQRARKLDTKLSRYDTLQITELDKLLPEHLKRIEASRKELLELYHVHHRDVTVIEQVNKINRESHVLIGSEVARMQKNVLNTRDDLVQLEAEFSAYWAPQHNVTTRGAQQLHEKLNAFRHHTNQLIEQMKKPSDTATVVDLPDYFYKKWLTGLDEETPDLPHEPSPRLSRRRSSRIMATPPSRPRLSTSTTNMSSSTTATAATEQKVVRRKLLDPKSELKNQIFGMHVRPEPIDCPTRITGLIFDRITRILDAYEDYYKGKGLRQTTRPNLLLETFERSSEKVKADIIEYEQKAIAKTNDAFGILQDVVNRTEKLHGTLPRIMFDYFYQKETETTKYNLSKIQIRRQKLMDAYEEAKNEHFASIRINIGHPSYATQLSDLCARESARLAKHSSATKDRAESLVEALNDGIVGSLKAIHALVQSLFDEFDQVVKLCDIMPTEFRDNCRMSKTQGLIQWGQFNTVGLPAIPATSSPFTSKRETLAHHELTAEKELLLMKVKHFYRDQMQLIEDQEKEQLFEIDRWHSYWELQLSEIKSCYDD